MLRTKQLQLQPSQLHSMVFGCPFGLLFHLLFVLDPASLKSWGDLLGTCQDGAIGGGCAIPSGHTANKDRSLVAHP
eukprot:4367021-Amphidinium_carterae.1